MATESSPEAVAVRCPGCGSGEVRAVPEVCADHGAMRDGLADRLARTPGVASCFDSWLHFVEGLLMAGIGVALAHSGIGRDKPLYTIGGSLLAVLAFVGTIVVVRGEVRERALVAVGESRADRLWRSACRCSGCASVFCPDGVPWQGLLTPEQFKKFVWTEAGYGKRLEEEFEDVDMPSGILTLPGGRADHA